MTRGTTLLQILNFAKMREYFTKRRSQRLRLAHKFKLHFFSLIPIFFKRSVSLATIALHIFLTMAWELDAVPDNQIVPKDTTGLVRTPRVNSAQTEITIAAPNNNKVSHNLYEQFDLGTGGVNIDNTLNASLIISEVLSLTDDRSVLRGETRIINNDADYIFVNQDGIDCVGCSFSGANKLFLTTGTLQAAGGELYKTTFADNEALHSIDITGTGKVTIDGGDFSTTDYFAIVSSSISLAKDIEAKDFHAYAGGGSFDYSSKILSGTPTNIGTPVLDASKLGALRANQIYLNIADRGVGVKVSGTMAASAGNLVIRSDGSIEFMNGSTLQSKTGNIELDAGTSDISIGEDNTKHTLVEAWNDIKITAGNLHNSADLRSGVDFTGTQEQYTRIYPLRALTDLTSDGTEDLAKITQGLLSLLA